MPQTLWGWLSASVKPPRSLSGLAPILRYSDAGLMKLVRSLSFSQRPTRAYSQPPSPQPRAPQDISVLNAYLKR